VGGHGAVALLHQPYPQRFQHQLQLKVHVSLAGDIAAAAEKALVRYLAHRGRGVVQITLEQLIDDIALAGGAVSVKAFVLPGRAAPGEVHPLDIVIVDPPGMALGGIVPGVIAIMVQVQPQTEFLLLGFCAHYRLLESDTKAGALEAQITGVQNIIGVEVLLEAPQEGLLVAVAAVNQVGDDGIRPGEVSAPLHQLGGRLAHHLADD